MKKAKPQKRFWIMCEQCTTGSVLRTPDGQLLDCICLVEKRYEAIRGREDRR